MQRAILLLTVFSSVAGADELSGTVELGMRNVSTEGAPGKYREDVNLDDGARLFKASLLYRTSTDREGWPDLVALDLTGLGGDPYEDMRLRVQRYGAWSFSARRHRSDYVHDDLLVLPQDASISGSTGGDFHRYDIERLQDDVRLEATLNERATLEVGFNRYRRHGESETTLDIQRDEFELEQPVDEESLVYRLGLRYRWDTVSVAIEERIRDVENSGTAFLPGASSGLSPGDATYLDFYVLDRPWNYRAYEHTVRARAEPQERLSVELLAGYTTLDLDLEVAERGAGVGYTGAPFAVDDTGIGRAARDALVIDLDISYDISDSLQLLAGLKSSSLDQSGNTEFGLEGGASEWDIDERLLELGLSFAATNSIAISVGYLQHWRDSLSVVNPAAAASLGDDVESEARGLFAAIDYRPDKRLSVRASMNDYDIDDPFSLAAPRDSDRYRLRARYRFDNGLSVNLQHQQQERRNDLAAWRSDVRQTALRASWSSDNLTAALGAGRSRVETDYTRLVTGGSRQDLFEVAYLADTDYADASLRWQASDRWTAGGAFRRYANDGSIAVSRDDSRVFVEMGLADGYAVRLDLRRIDYSEDSIEYYDANLVEFALRKTFP